MLLLKGQTLQQSVEREGRLKYEVAVNYIAQLSEAVGYIHERNILHRDIKPENIIVTPENRAVLIDFGSAREFVHDKTAAHTSILTVGYAPLEQYSASSKKGSYTDIYSLGATFYFALTGEKPMDAAARMTEPMPEPQKLVSSIPDEANYTIMKAMQLKPDTRYQRVDEFMNDLLNNNGAPSGGGKKKSIWLIFLGFVATIVLSLFLPQIIGSLNNHSDSQSATEIPPVETTIEPVKPAAKTLTADEIHRLSETRDRANDFYDNYVKLNDPDILKFALEQCNEALEIKPDDRDMLELKKKITGQ
jgi:serine/threonine protein kinase